MNKPLDTMVAALNIDETTVKNRGIRISAALKARLEYLSQRGGGSGFPEAALTGEEAIAFANSIRAGVELEEAGYANGRLGADLFAQFRHKGTTHASEAIPASGRAAVEALLALLDEGNGAMLLQVIPLDD